MAKVVSDIGLVAQAVGKIADIVAEFQKTKRVRAMRKTIEYGDKYIRESEGNKEKKLLRKYKKLFYHFMYK